MPLSDNDFLEYVTALYAAQEQLDWGIDPEGVRAAAEHLRSLNSDHALVHALHAKMRQMRAAGDMHREGLEPQPPALLPLESDRAMADVLARLKALEDLVKDQILLEGKRWDGVHARIAASEVAFEVLANVSQTRDPSLVSDLVQGLSAIEAEARSLNFHIAFVTQVQRLGQTLSEQLEDLVTEQPCRPGPSTH